MVRLPDKPNSLAAATKAASVDETDLTEGEHRRSGQRVEPKE